MGGGSGVGRGVGVGGGGSLGGARGGGGGGKDGGSGGLRLLVRGVATSIDALAVGVIIAMQDVRIWIPAAVIGVVTAILCAVGVQVGHRIGTRLGRTAEVVGGVVLVGLGIRILIEHLA